MYNSTASWGINEISLAVVGRGQTLLMLYWTMVCSKLDYGYIVYGTASNTNLQQLNSIHNAGIRLALGSFCTSPVPSMYTEANEAPLEERQLKLSMDYHLKTRACTDNPAHHALHVFEPNTRDLYLPKPNGEGGMTQHPAQPIGLKLEEATVLPVSWSPSFACTYIPRLLHISDCFTVSNHHTYTDLGRPWYCIV